MARASGFVTLLETTSGPIALALVFGPRTILPAC
jgi:hypothetical protein